MKTFNIKLFFSAVLLAICSASFAQRENLDSLVSALKTYRENSYQEKLYVHLHRTTLFTGEMLWFKVYNVDGSFHQPSDLSKVAYIELIDQNNRAVLQSKVRISKDGGSGSVFIPATILTGNYTFRAYTSWMKNFNPDYFYHTTVSVINPFVKPEYVIASTGTEPAIRAEFFPEGGNLVTGLTNRVAYKLSAKGSPVSGRLWLIGPAGDTLSQGEVNPFGLGRFLVKPVASADCKAYFVDGDGRSSWHNFPAPVDAGYTMIVRDSADNLAVIVSAADQGSRELRQVYMVVHARLQIIRAETKPLYPSSATFIIPKSTLPDGVTHITVFDGNRRPVCERLFFTTPKSKLDIIVSSDQQQYGVRRKVALQLGSSANASMSVAVYKLDSIAPQSYDGIQEYMWLTSDLAGKIHSPEYYFNPSNPRVAEYADILMMTHGWRRFSWNDVLGKRQEHEFIPEVRGHLMKGRVLTQDDAPASGVLTMMASPGKIARLYSSRSNVKGEILFDASDFAGTKKIIVQTVTAQDSTTKLAMTSPFSLKTGSDKLPSLQLNPVHEKQLLERSISMQLQDIYLGDRIIQTTIAPRDSFPFYGRPDETYLLDKFTRFPVMEEVMREYVPGVLVRKRRDGFHFILINKESRGVLEDDPLVLLDGIPVADVDKIMAFNPLKIRKLDVVLKNWYLGPMSFPGIVSYSTYEGDLAGFELDPRAVSIDYEGLQLQREFYVPQYENIKQRNARMADQRNLLFWAPDVNVSAGEKKQLDFFTSDLSGDFIVVVQGLGNNGAGGQGTTTFSVKKTEY